MTDMFVKLANAFSENFVVLRDFYQVEINQSEITHPHFYGMFSRLSSINILYRCKIYTTLLVILWFHQFQNTERTHFLSKPIEFKHV